MTRTKRDALPLTIKTERLLLRTPIRGDVPALVRIANNIRIAEMLVRLPHPYTTADGIAFVEVIAQRSDERPYVIETADGSIVGIVSFSFADGHPPELGYWLGEPYWGKGYAREAVRGLIGAAQKTGLFPLINARVMSHNFRSAHLLETIGFSWTHEEEDKDGSHRGLPLSYYRLDSLT